MTPTEATELFQGITSRLVGILGACLVFGVLGFVALEMLTTQPQASVIATMNPDAKSETYFVRHDSESFIRIATDGTKTITHIDSKRLTWLLTAGLSGIVLFFLRWPIAGLVIGKQQANKSCEATGDNVAS